MAERSDGSRFDIGVLPNRQRTATSDRIGYICETFCNSVTTITFAQHQMRRVRGNPLTVARGVANERPSDRIAQGS